LGVISKDLAVMNPEGFIVQEEWLRSPFVRPNVALDAYAIMPNHIHGILVLGDSVGATRRVAPTPHQRPGPLPGSIAAIIAQFKGQSARRINLLRGNPGARVWQRNYDEHIVRDEQDLQRLREYIANNPLRWALDEENPARIPAPADR
jgi:REP element-mobilizing transposase RayT